MERSEKELLYKDLTARLPYGVKCACEWKTPAPNETAGYVTELTTFLLDQYMLMDDEDDVPIKSIRPYLRPMHSMTDEEKKEMHEIISPEGTAIYKEEGISTPASHFGGWIPYEYISRVVDWLNEHHFDFRGLIERKLAISIDETNNPYKS